MFQPGLLGRHRLGCWFYVALVALATNPLVWRVVLTLLQWVLQLIAVHVSTWSFS